MAIKSAVQTNINANHKWGTLFDDDTYMSFSSPVPDRITQCRCRIIMQESRQAT